MTCVLCLSLQEAEPLPLDPCSLSDGGLCDVCGNIEQLQLEMCRARQRMEDLRRAYVDEVDAYKTLQEKYRKLWVQRNRKHDPLLKSFPPEIISTIFQHCISHVPFDTEIYGHGIQDLQSNALISLKLTAVCKDWSTLARSTHHLWRHILIPLDSSKLEQHVDTLRHWLDRSGKLPLFIRITCSKSRLKSSDQSIQTVIDIINQESSRWEVLDLRVPSYMAAKFVGDSSGGPSMMRSLRLQQADRMDAGYQFEMQISKPSPSSVFLDCIAYKKVAIRWSNVTWIHAEALCLGDCLDLLTSAPQIRYCRLMSITRDGGTHSSQSAVTHLSLEDLTLTFEKFVSLNAFLERVSLPLLKRLVVENAEDDLEVDGFISFLKRSSSPLEELSIECARYNTPDIIRLFKTLPSLSKLELSGPKWTRAKPPANSLLYSPDAFFVLLAETSLKTTGEHDATLQFLPKLQSLHLDALHPCSWDIVASVFGPINQLGHPCRRPLNTVHLYTYRLTTAELEVDKQTTLDLLDIAKAGVTLSTEPWSLKDILKASMTHHGMPIAG